MKELGEHVPPAVVAQKVMDQLPSNDHIKSWDIAGPGFVNIFLQPSFVSKLVTSVLLKGAGPPMVQPRRVVIDFSSPNIAKEMHVGHLRSTIIGETLSRLLEFVGHDVLRYITFYYCIVLFLDCTSIDLLFSSSPPPI